MRQRPFGLLAALLLLAVAARMFGADTSPDPFDALTGDRFHKTPDARL